jgi:hypothetical protein
MSKIKSKPARTSKSKAERLGLKALPWATLLQGGIVVRERWHTLSERDRARLTELVRESRGRLSGLSAKERDELRKLLRRLDLKGMGRDLLPLARGRGRGRKRR